MTKDGGFKKVVRHHAQDTGQRYTEALTDLERSRCANAPRARCRAAARPSEGSLWHRPGRGDEAQRAQDLRVPHRQSDGDPWVARAFPPARPRAGVEGDAAILRFLERQGYPAERPAVDDAVSDFDGSVGPRDAVRRRRSSSPTAQRSSP